MPKIALEISPQSDYITNNILMIRKFFNMIFINRDGLSLHIYTAIIFSSGRINNSSKEYFPTCEANRTGLKFQYSGAKNIRFFNITESIFNQCEHLERIWGDCNKLENGTIIQKIKEKYPSENISSNIYTPSKAMLILEKDQFTSQACIVDKGEFHSWEADNYYTIAEANTSMGIEYLNWIKTEVQFDSTFINDNLELSVKFNMPEDITCYCPDYMWYICTPNELINDLSASYVSFNESKFFPNFLQLLADTTAVHFQEWVTDESIDKCKRYRLKFEGQKSPELEKKSNITLKLSILELKEKHGNQQFFTGLLFAFLLSYVSDFTRLGELYAFIIGTSDPFMGTHVFELLFPINLIMIYLSIIIPITYVTRGLNRKSENFIKFCKMHGIGISITNLALFFVIFPILKWNNIWHSILETNKIVFIITLILEILGLICTGIYVLYACLKKKIDFRNYL